VFGALRPVAFKDAATRPGVSGRERNSVAAPGDGVMNAIYHAPSL